MSMIHDQQVCSLDFSPENPARKPEWRWLRHLGGFKPWRDTFAHRMWACRAAKPNRILLQVLEVYEGDHFRRAELEARMLARQSDAQIAKRMDLDPPVVSWYRGAFFDVDEKLEFPSWITHCVLRTEPSGVLGKDDIPWLWKHTGYWLGLVALEELLQAVDRQELLEWGIDAYFQKSSRLSMDMKLSIAARRLRVPRTPAEFVRWQRVKERCDSRRLRTADPEILSPLKLRVILPEERLAEERVETVVTDYRAVI